MRDLQTNERYELTDAEVTQAVDMDEPRATMFQSMSIDVTPVEVDALRHEAEEMAQQAQK
jgi:hypothetical protein